MHMLNNADRIEYNPLEEEETLHWRAGYCDL